MLHQVFHKVCVNCVQAKHSTTYTSSVKHYDWALCATLVTSQGYFELQYELNNANFK